MAPLKSGGDTDLLFYFQVFCGGKQVKRQGREQIIFHTRQVEPIPARRPRCVPPFSQLT
jgi:hypothetical protein